MPFKVLMKGPFITKRVKQLIIEHRFGCSGLDWDGEEGLLGLGTLFYRPMLAKEKVRIERIDATSTLQKTKLVP